MKKIVLLCMAAALSTFFAGCQKDEINGQLTDNVQQKSATVPNVYSENGYLVFKNIETLDSIAQVMNQEDSTSQVSWEEYMHFESARTYRAKLNDEIFSTDDYSVFLKKANEAASEGYFNKKDSCMDYPFSNYSWASVLNKDGIVKVGDILYAFSKKGGIAMSKGTPELISLARKGGALPTGIEYTQFGNSLKSATINDYRTINDYGKYFKTEKRNRKYKLSVYLSYDVIKVKRRVYIPDVHDFKDVMLPDGVKYEIYCHQQKKGTFGWRDYQTHLSYKDFAVKIGGNSIPEINFTYPAVNYSDSNPSLKQPSNALSNHFILLYDAKYPFKIVSDNPPAAPKPPTVRLIDFKIWTRKTGNESDPIHFVVQ
ncbi:hypothetical protein PbJCM13498_39200 [Prolixibacter bellariivorans]|uniref:DUF4848 domain-containing protein n=1 Tax=Prolixibacter bellariivorans TaxID=314319 RepID=A0A5M4B5Q4_9BACT|nr:hypothetical protein [Prolixibacter bellariivorans]GET35057.1 hypothetical protein PbJCM13498_39200 [Prolixibacter bellariivorans]